MHKYYSLFFSVLLFLTACKSNKTPSGIIKQPQMIALLTEIHIADGALYSVVQIPDSLYKHGTGKYLAIFKRFHTDSAQFKKSFRYYCLNPEKLQTIYEQILVNLKLKADSLNELNKKQVAKDTKRIADSLKKLPKTPPIVPPVNKGPNPKRILTDKPI